MKANWVCDFCDKNVFHYNRKPHLRHHHRLELASRMVYDLPQRGGMYKCNLCEREEDNLFQGDQIREHVRQKHLERHITKFGNSYFQRKDQ